MEAPDIKTPLFEWEKTEIISDNTRSDYTQDTYTWLVDLLGDIEWVTEETPPEVKALIDEISDINNFSIKLKVDFHGIICSIHTNSGKKYTAYIGIYDSNYKYWYYNNKIIIDNKTYIFQTKDDDSLSDLADDILNNREDNLAQDKQKQIVANIIKQYKPIKSFK